MKCQVIKTAGITAIVCGSAPRRRKCSCCGNPSSLLCDYPVAQGQLFNGGEHGTCDKPLCTRCAVSVGPDRDYCPDHPQRTGG